MKTAYLRIDYVVVNASGNVTTPFHLKIPQNGRFEYGMVQDQVSVQLLNLKNKF